MEYLHVLKTNHPSGDHFDDLMRLYEERLWHQLSIKLTEILSKESILNSIASIQIYDEFIITFEGKINEVKLAHIISLVGRKLSLEQALELYNRVLTGKTKLGVDGKTCISMEIALNYLTANRIQEAKELIEAAKGVHSEEAYVHSRVYMAQLEYFKLLNSLTEFYNAALLFLSFTVLGDLDESYRKRLGEDMAIAALTGEHIYNFGEVLATPILSSLYKYGATDSAELLFPLVQGVSRGQVCDVQSLLSQHFPYQNSRMGLVVEKRDIILEKTRLLAVVNLAFERPAHQRLISFSDLSKHTLLSQQHVEKLLMRAMSVGLLRGNIDQVSSTLQVTWIQPRVLDKPQLQEMHEQLSGWVDRTKNAFLAIEDQAIELYT